MLDALAPLRGALLYELFYIRGNWAGAARLAIPLAIFMFVGTRSFAGSGGTIGGIFLAIFAARGLSSLNFDLAGGTAAIYLRTRARSGTLIFSKWLIQFFTMWFLLSVVFFAIRMSSGGALPAEKLPHLLVAAAAISASTMVVELLPRQLQFLGLAMYGLVGAGLSVGSHAHEGFLWVPHLIPWLGAGYAVSSAMFERAMPWTMYVSIGLWVGILLWLYSMRFKQAILDRL